ncbi:UNVERIFIED_CONTAM: hypothetical protein GTU68_061261 [Idotea baltica]|nr:hypothetical protein [Idotea baltica]
MSNNDFIPLDYSFSSANDSLRNSETFLKQCVRRRTVRDYADKPVSRQVIENCVRTAASAPSGANQQPWHFSLIQDADIKRQIRVAAEAEEREFYQSRATDEWLDALKPFGTNSDKPFLEIAPWLIAVFCQRYGLKPDGSQTKHYYATESTGIATGLLVTAIHNAGLASLTHTPSPMGFLSQILDRPENERAFVLLAVGYPATTCQVPNIQRKAFDKIATWH